MIHYYVCSHAKLIILVGALSALCFLRKAEVSSLFCDTPWMTEALAGAGSTRVFLQLGVFGSPSQKGAVVWSNNLGLLSCLHIMFKQGKALLLKHGQLRPVTHLAMKGANRVRAFRTVGHNDRTTSTLTHNCVKQLRYLCMFV